MNYSTIRILPIVIAFTFSLTSHCTYKQVYDMISELIKTRKYNHVITTYPTIAKHKHIIKPAIKKFAQTPGFLETLTQFVVASLKRNNSVIGYKFEIEVALEIVQENTYKSPSEQEKILFFNQRIHAPNTGIKRQFDIITNNKFIECKTVNWRHAKHCRDQFTDQQQIVDELNELELIPKTFYVHSKHPLPNAWKRWFKTNNILVKSDHYCSTKDLYELCDDEASNEYIE